MKKKLTTGKRGQLAIFVILGIVVILTVAGAFVIGTFITSPMEIKTEEQFSAESALRKASECSVFSHGMYATNLELEALKQFNRMNGDVQNPSIKVEKNANDVLFSLVGTQITQTNDALRQNVYVPAKQNVRLKDIEREYESIRRDNNLNAMETMNSTVINNEVILLDDRSTIKGTTYWYRR